MLQNVAKKMHRCDLRLGGDHCVVRPLHAEAMFVLMNRELHWKELCICMTQHKAIPTAAVSS